MNQTNKIRVAVLYGGRSPEHDVSLQSAKNVIEQLDKKRFHAIPIGIDKTGQWFLGNDALLMPREQTWFSPSWISKPALRFQSTTLPTSLSTAFDVVFPAVHGAFCEDGTLQGLLESADLPYVGCGVLSSAITMDKDVSKRLAREASIPVGPYFVIKKASFDQHKEALLTKIKTELKLPVFVKPANTGSSIGITKVSDEHNLLQAIEVAFYYDHKILIEKALNVRELEIAVLESLESDNPIVSVVGEIKPKHEFYSYEAKYEDEKGAELIIPAAISKEIADKAKQIAKELFLILECTGMARIDLFLDEDDQEIYFNEANTIPGFTAISMYPKLIHASNISYTELLSRLIDLAIMRHDRNKSLLKTKMK